MANAIGCTWGREGALLGERLASLACFLTDPYLHTLLKTHWKPLLFCLALVLIWRIPTEGGFFHGLEYEDSYVYTVAGRQMAEHFRIEPSGPTLPYSINVCAVGSLTSCKLSDNYPEHLIGYPYVLSVLFKVFGYHSSIGSIANVVCACLVGILIFLLCMVIADDVIVAGSAALIFAITPIFAVWGLETSAEPISNGCMSLVLWFCLRYVFVCPERTAVGVGSDVVRVYRDTSIFPYSEAREYSPSSCLAGDRLSRAFRKQEYAIFPFSQVLVDRGQRGAWPHV